MSFNISDSNNIYNFLGDSWLEIPVTGLCQDCDMAPLGLECHIPCPEYLLYPQCLHTFFDTADMSQETIPGEKRKEREDDSLDLAKRAKPIERQNTFSSIVNKVISPIRDQPPSSPKGRLQKNSTRTCSSCTEEKTTKFWHKDPTTGLVDRCRACYNRAKEEKTQNCSSCAEEKTTKFWYKNLLTGLSDRCKSCYDRAKERKIQICSSCGEEKIAKQWYKDPTTGLVDRCRACYNRARKEKTQI